MAGQESASQTGAQERDFGGEIIYPDLLLLIEQVAGSVDDSSGRYR